VRRDRAERGLKRLCFELFYKTMDWISDFPIPNQTGIFGLLDRKALNELNRLPEKNRFLPGLRAWIGFEQRTVVYERQERAAGAPKQTFFRLVRYAMDGFLSFSYKPLRLMFGAGAFISISGFILAVSFIVRRIMGTEPSQTGFTTLVTLLLFLGGVQLMAIGLLGEYLGRVYDEVKQRPLYIVKRHYRGPDPGADTHATQR
jgi:dolichol-phosphate mannosyltransferase